MSTDPNRRVDVAVGADLSGLKPGMQDAGKAVEDFGRKAEASGKTAGQAFTAFGATAINIADTVRDRWLQLPAAFQGVGAAGAAIAAGLAGAFSFGQLISGVRQTVDALDDLNDAADATGSSIENLSALEDVARRNGGTLTEVSGILVKFNAVLKEADGQNGVSRALQQIGLDVQALKREDPAEALRQVAVALSQYADDGDKARLVQELFGKSIRDAAPFLKDLAEKTSLVGSVTTEAAQKAETFNKQLFELQTLAGNVTRGWVSEMLPGLIQITKGLTDAEEAAKALNLAWERTREFRQMFGFGALVPGFNNNGPQEELARLRGEAQTRRDRIAFDPTGPDAAGARRQLADLERQIQALEGSAMLSRLGITPSDLAGGRGTTVPAQPSVGPMLAEIVGGGGATGTMNPLGSAFDGADKTYQQMQALKRRIEADNRAFNERMAAQSQQLSQIQIDSQRDAILSGIALEEEGARQRLARGEITAAQMLQLDQQFEQMRQQARQQALQQSLLLIDPQRDPVQYAQVLAQIEALERQHVLTMAQIQGRADQQTLNTQTALATSVTNLWQRGMQALQQGTLTWRGAWQAVLGEVGQAAMKTFQNIVLSWIQSNTTMKLVGKETSLAMIHQSAMEAGAGAYKAVVGIPIIGPVLAPAAAAVAYAGTMAFASAEGGYDIPAGVNPLVQAHAKEMVLPAAQADVIRAMADGGVGAAGGGAVTLNFTRSREGYIETREDEFLREFGRLNRNFKLKRS